ncbi:FecR domain-containing protein [Achromobacter seleniivolatilans]|uniref:FecR domain-containing protein n=1 Tax=Achromobacter seleniivolatilans TaxID=3047478 RepID=A0ABY9M2Y4_9BURK|nr:FecR domain-containing protein [Achromobacter sp. R39]WMD21361.1 FecR domain-containing protein [Achromobacter sp. R39]
MAQPFPADPTEEASRWVILKSGQHLDDDAHAAFEAWHRADARHAAAYDRLSRLWRRMGEIDRGKLAKRPARKLRATVMLTLLAATFAGWFGSTRPELQADYLTTASLRQISLPDGSIVVLDAHSALALNFADGRREVRLLAGRALFEPVPRQPGMAAFSVVTGDATATALGTRYTVERLEGKTRVSVLEHQVEVGCLPCTEAQHATLSAGEAVDVSAAGITRQTQAGAATPGWSRGLLSFDDVPLQSAADELARYTGKTILVMSDAAKAQRVSGTANVADPQRALELLLAQTPVRVTNLPGLLILR